MKKVFFAFVLLLAVVGFYILSKNPQFNEFLFNKNSTRISIPSGSTKITQPITQSKTTTANVSITTSGFSPQVLTVKTGTKVIWTNRSGGIVNISSDPHPLNNAYPPLNLGNFDNGLSLSLSFDKSGTYKYHNFLIPSQQGSIVVQ